MFDSPHNALNVNQRASFMTFQTFAFLTLANYGIGLALIKTKIFSPVILTTLKKMFGLFE